MWTGLESVFPANSARDVWFWKRHYSGSGSVGYRECGISGTTTGQWYAMFYHISGVDMILYQRDSTVPDILYANASNDINYPQNNEWSILKTTIDYNDSLQVTNRRFRQWTATDGDTGELIDSTETATFSVQPSRIYIGAQYDGGFFGFINTTRFAHIAVTDAVYDDDKFLYFTQYTPDIAAQLAGVNIYFHKTLNDASQFSESNVTSINVSAADLDADMPDLLSSLPVSPFVGDPVTVLYPIQQSGFRESSVDNTIANYRATRLSVSSPTSGSTKTQWEINVGGDNFYITTTSNTTASGSVIGGTTTYLDYWFPPSQEGTVRYREYVGGNWTVWSSSQEFTALGYLNSYQMYSILNRGTTTY